MTTNSGPLTNQKDSEKTLLERLNAVLDKMSVFVDVKNVDEAIQTVLDEIIRQFDVDRSYILSYSADTKLYSCTHEAVANGITKEGDKIQGFSEFDLPWWFDQAYHNKPIILNSVNELPESAYRERYVLESQNIKSMLLVPVTFHQVTYGCLGLDIVQNEYSWTRDDFESYSLIAKMLGTCILLQNSESHAVELMRNLSIREKLFSNIFKNTPIAYELYDLNGFLIDHNKKDMEVFGINDSADTMGLNILENPNLDADQVRTLRSGEKLAFHIEYDFAKARTYYKSYSAGKKNLFVQIIPIKDENNILSNFLLLAIDEMDTREVYNKVKNFELMFSEISNLTKVGYVKWNITRQDGFAVKQWFTNWGESEDTPISFIISHYDHVHSEDRRKLLDFYSTLDQYPQSSFNEVVRVENGNGGWKWIHLLNMISFKDDSSLEIIGMTFDVTREKELELSLIQAKEKAEDMDRLKSRFLANMSHEIRTPLNAIVGFSNVLLNLEDDCSQEEKESYKSIINQNAQLLLGLINDILDLSKIESGTTDIVIQPVDINALMKDFKLLFASKMKEGVAFNIPVSDTPCMINSDHNRIVQILTNFITNAIKNTNKGSITVSYREEDGMTEFSVEDTGVGIPSDKQDKIFQSFVKLNAFKQGTGLGLAICKSLVTAMKGDIGVYSDGNSGSRFWFKIPNN